ncbi:NnrU family protein [Albirhodobacter sp. R86504]|uniref:NnrU family protein n=1 Tax=Albirhodobacter sp. R86504 TaxID=3093848 RepID=UPI00366A8AAD
MTLLILGILLWVLPHSFKRVAPAARMNMGKQGRSMVAGLVIFGVVLMVIGYRMAPVTPIYTPVPGIGHLNNLMMLVSVYLFGVGGTKGILYPKMRHPMLWGMVIWAVAHLLVNGDLASILLFGSLGLWALNEMRLINQTAWVRPTNGRGIKGDAMNVVGTLVLFGLFASVHIWLGHNPFVGTYG